MNEQMNMLLELLEEIKQQNRETLKLLSTDQNNSNSPNEELAKHLNSINEAIESVLYDSQKTRNEFLDSAATLGERINELSKILSKSTQANSEVMARLENSQNKLTPPITRKYYLLDAKRWIQWAIWGMLILLVASFSVGMFTYIRLTKVLMTTHSDTAY